MKANLKLFYVSILTAVGAAVNFIPLLIAGGPRSVPAAEVPLPEFNPPPCFVDASQLIVEEFFSVSRLSNSCERLPDSCSV